MATYGFLLSDEERRSGERWLKRHFCENRKQEHATWKFVLSSGIGITVIVSCSCGREKNVTDYDTW